MSGPSFWGEDINHKRGRETGARQSFLRAACPRCGAYVCIRLDGYLRKHGPQSNPCVAIPAPTRKSPPPNESWCEGCSPDGEGDTMPCPGCGPDEEETR